MTDGHPITPPPEPSDQQLRVFACEWWRKFGFVKNKATCAWVIDEIDPEHFVDFLRDALARWGCQSTTEGPAVSEDREPASDLAKYGN